MKGMERSSKKTVRFLLSGGTYNLDCFLPTEDSMESWKFAGVVKLEKLILLKSILEISNLEAYIRMTDVLAVPGPPTRSECWKPGSPLFLSLIAGKLAILSMMNSALVESDVGISN
jgi:hypothetical protein